MSIFKINKEIPPQSAGRSRGWQRQIATAVKSVMVCSALLIGGGAVLATPAQAQSWADNRAHDKGCTNKTRVWHVRCEHSNGGWSHGCSNRSAGSFRGISVDSQKRLSDRAWTEVRTADVSCGWPAPVNSVGMIKPEKTWALNAITALDMTYRVRAGDYDRFPGMKQVNYNYYGVLQERGSSGVIRVRPSQLSSTRAFTHSNVMSGVNEVTIYRRYSRHVMNMVVFSDATTIYVSLWGTVDSENLLANAGIHPVINDAYLNTWTQPGYAGVAYEIWPEVKKEVIRQGGNTKTVVFTGHSMGGGVAGHLMFLAMKDRAISPTRYHRLITFGTPRYATDTFKAAFDQMIGRTYRNSKALTVENPSDTLINITNYVQIPNNLGGTYRPLGTWISGTPKKPLSNNPHSHNSYYSVVLDFM